MRTAETETAYQAGKTDLPGLLNEPALRQWQYWRLVQAAYPHDRVADQDHLLALKRTAEIAEILPDEFHELFWILRSLEKQYDCMLWNFPSMRSVHNIPHVHLYKLRPEFTR